MNYSNCGVSRRKAHGRERNRNVRTRGQAGNVALNSEATVAQAKYSLNFGVVRRAIVRPFFARVMKPFSRSSCTYS